jgi:hypothetical protein
MQRRLSKPALQLLGAALVFHLLLVQPSHPAALKWSALFVFPLELPALLLGLIALPSVRWSLAVRGLLVAALMIVALLKTADFAMALALGRGFNPVADIPLLEAGLRLTSGAIGPGLTLGAVLVAMVAVAGVAWALWWASGVWTRLAAPPLGVRASAAGALLFAGVAAAEVGHALGRWTLPVVPPGSAFTARVGVERIEMARATLADLRAFEAAAANDPYAARSGLLTGIDRDVLIVFVESYGRASLDNPLYAETHRATLSTAEEKLGALGLSMRSGILSAPTRGGQSWLSHATFSNGLWVADQTSYGAILASGRRTLFHLASDAGFRTAAVMPQITLEWPESSLMGFETVLAAGDLGYAGLPFNWVTMPDQFTFAALDRLLRSGADDRPLFAQIALGSSHAPWVPVPDLVAWESVGDGRIFNAMATSGDPPEVVWRDRDRVREQYRRALDYALRVVFDYAAQHAADPPLIFVVGDHQAAGFVAQDERPDVPVHVIGPEGLVARAKTWGWSRGLIPDDTVEVRPMAQMRDLILDAYSQPSGPGEGS